MANLDDFSVPAPAVEWAEDPPIQPPRLHPTKPWLIVLETNRGLTKLPRFLLQYQSSQTFVFWLSEAFVFLVNRNSADGRGHILQNWISVYQSLLALFINTYSPAIGSQAQIWVLKLRFVRWFRNSEIRESFHVRYFKLLYYWPD